ncbi:FeoB-associated Cys-rich membrane protein [Lentilactobacillus raoultii]|uniref:FeoB-associated Cys-rich membrane protein n=1 Tax=Lentilactobacillus raoultii TaxID=1987503 RepID=A0ABW3PNA2_9LACO
MGTLIVAVILFGLVGIAFYVRFLKKGAKGSCHECADVGCPLADRAKMVKNKKMKA